MEWVFGAAAVVVLAIGLRRYRVSRRNHGPQTAAVLSFIVGADLLVFAVVASLV